MAARPQKAVLRSEESAAAGLFTVTCGEQVACRDGELQMLTLKQPSSKLASSDSSASSGPLYEGLGCDDCKDSSQDETFPMDTIKARLMNGQGSTIAGTLRDIVKTQVSCNKGCSWLAMAAPTAGHSMYNSLRRCMMWDGAKVPLTGEALAGAMTACVQVIVTQPYEIVKLRQQTAAGQSLGATIKELGVSGLARGSSATLLRDVPFNALYAGLKGWIHNHMDAPDQPLISPFGLLAAGLGAGLLAGAVTTPADVIKTRMQADKTGRYKGLLDCINQMWAEGGSAAFLRGLGPRVALIPPIHHHDMLRDIPARLVPSDRTSTCRDQLRAQDGLACSCTSQQQACQMFM
ncbi:uncharacterized protein HaLaN_27292, partial [Haematococcus lacustris]